MIPFYQTDIYKNRTISRYMFIIMNLLPSGAYHISGRCQGVCLSFQCAVFLLSGRSGYDLKSGLTNEAIELYPRKKFIMANNHETIRCTFSKKSVCDS